MEVGGGGARWPARADYDAAAAEGIALLAGRGIEARTVGSYADGTLCVPYSDLDILAVAAPGEGPRVRDVVVEVARAMDGCVCAAFDPYDHQMLIYSVLDDGLHIDWFVVERTAMGERAVWRGEGAVAMDTACRAWSPLLYVLSFLLGHKANEREIASGVLAEHWTWLALQGIDVSSLPSLRPRPDDDLFDLLSRTARVLPRHARLAPLFEGRFSEAMDRMQPDGTP